MSWGSPVTAEKPGMSSRIDLLLMPTLVDHKEDPAEGHTGKN